MSESKEPTEGPTVAICIPVADKLEPRFWRSLNALWKPGGGRIPGHTHRISVEEMLVEDARNELTDEALASPEITHLLFIDDDMTFDPDALERLLKHDLPIVGGLCFSRRVPYHPVLCRKHPDWMARPRTPFGFVYHYPPNALFQVDATGGAFLLIKREVFEKIDATAVARGEEKGAWWARAGGLSEDFSFCSRAVKVGYEIYVDTGCRIGHVAKVVITEETASKLRPYEWEIWNPEISAAKGDEPRATVVIPTYNQNPRYLRAAVLSAAYQTVPVEVIVVDDGSDPPVPTDGWPENVRVVRQDNKGVASALNSGICEMRTDWFCWLSSDDMFDPRKVEIQQAALAQSGLKASFHAFQSLRSEETFSRAVDVPRWQSIPQQMEILRQVCAINGSTVMIHKSVIDEVGLLDEELRYGQDYEYWLRVGQKHFWYPLTDLLTTRREFNNLTAAIAADPEKTKVRDAEDARIHARYAEAR